MKALVLFLSVTLLYLLPLETARPGCASLGGGCGLPAPSCASSPKIGTKLKISFPSCPATTTVNRLFFTSWPTLPGWELYEAFGWCSGNPCSVYVSISMTGLLAPFTTVDIATGSLGTLEGDIPNEPALVGSRLILANICGNPGGDPDCLGATGSLLITFEA